MDQFAVGVGEVGKPADALHGHRVARRLRAHIFGDIRQRRFHGARAGPSAAAFTAFSTRFSAAAGFFAFRAGGSLFCLRPGDATGAVVGAGPTWAGLAII